MKPFANGERLWRLRKSSARIRHLHSRNLPAKWLPGTRPLTLIRCLCEAPFPGSTSCSCHVPFKIFPRNCLSPMCIHRANSPTLSVLRFLPLKKMAELPFTKHWKWYKLGFPSDRVLRALRGVFGEQLHSHSARNSGGWQPVYQQTPLRSVAN